MKTPEAVLAEARRWIGTPYRHGAALRGVGCDCLGLVIGLRHALAGGVGPAQMPLYPPDWAEASRAERLAEACAQALLAVEGEPAPADLLLFRWRAGRPAGHLAMLGEAGTIIHAHVRCVVAEVPLAPAWRRRIAAAFRLPEIS